MFSTASMWLVAGRALVACVCGPNHARFTLRAPGWSRRHYAEPKQVCRITRVGFVATVLDAFVLFDRHCVSQVYSKPSRLQAIHELAPIECRLHYHLPAS
jgi:hypothetical protein